MDIKKDELEKDELEKRKLKLEIKDLNSKFYQNWQFWIRAITILISFVAIYFAGQSKYFENLNIQIENQKSALEADVVKLKEDSIQFEYRIDSLKKYEAYYEKIKTEYVDSIVELSLQINNDIIGEEGANFLFARVSYTDNLIYELNYEGVYASGCPDSIQFLVLNKEYKKFTINVNKEGCFMEIPKKYIPVLSTKHIFKYICFIGEISWVLDPKKPDFFKQNLTK